MYEARRSSTTSLQKTFLRKERGEGRNAGYRVVLLELVGTRARQGDDVGWFKMADANKKGFGKRCSNRRDRETAGTVCCRPGYAVVC